MLCDGKSQTDLLGGHQPEPILQGTFKNDFFVETAE